jgi:uncharacterized protein YraI
MRTFLQALAICCLFASHADAQIRKFPYRAIVEANTVNIRSGPGRRYYATGRASRGEQIVVHRHDPGGWYMIAPPKGSFSWIRAEYVKKVSSQQGLVTENKVVVWVGSALSDDHNVKQRTLATDDRVEILGEAVFPVGGRPVRMYQIAPPRHEYRWISGKYLTPADQAVRRNRDRNPFQTPAQAIRSESTQNRFADPEQSPGDTVGNHAFDQSAVGQPEADPKFVERKIVRTYDDKAVHRRGPELEKLEADRAQLKELDFTFRKMVQQDIKNWQFDELEQEYRDFQETVSLPALASQVDQRFEAIARYRGLKAEYQEFVQLTSSTTEREQSLLAAQQQQTLVSGTPVPATLGTFETPVIEVPSGPNMTAPPMAPRAQFQTRILPPARPGAQRMPNPLQPMAPGGMSPVAIPANVLPPIPAAPAVTSPNGRMVPVNPNPPALVLPTPSVQQQTTPAPTANPTTLPSAQVSPQRFDGAGLVQKTAVSSPGAPQHVLLAPNGRILAYLRSAPGVNLDGFLGREMGINGQRFPDPKLRNDLIVVEQLTPVRLLPPSE